MTQASRLTIAVTGAAGFVGSGLIHELCLDDRIERVLGFDVRPPATRHPKFVFDEVDIRNPALESRFQGVDVVVHLAFIMDPIRDEVLMRDVNLNGSQNVFRCAAQAGVSKIVYTSTAVAYGAHPDNDIPLTEESPLRANLDFSYPAHKLEVEYVLKEMRREFPDLTFTVFRPAIVFGPNADNAWSHQLEMPILFRIRGYAPPFQFVHEDDVRAALVFAVFNDLDGAYNLAAEGWLGADEMKEMIGRPTFEISEARAFAMVDKMWAAGLGEAPPGMLHYVMHPWVMSVEKLAAAGFKCARSNREALEATLSRTREYIRLGHNRTKRTNVAVGAAAGLGLVGTFAALRSVRSRGN